MIKKLIDSGLKLMDVIMNDCVISNDHIQIRIYLDGKDVINYNHKTGALLYDWALFETDLRKYIPNITFNDIDITISSWFKNKTGLKPNISSSGIFIS